MTQGDPVSPTLFNIIVDSVFRATIQDIYGPQGAQYGFGWLAREHNICFYADNVLISVQDPIWVQTELTKMVRMFEIVGLQTNLNKTKSVICGEIKCRLYSMHVFLYSVLVKYLYGIVRTS